MPATLLVADNDPVFCQLAQSYLERRGYRVLLAHSSTEAQHLLQHERVALAIIDYRLDNDQDELDASGLWVAQSTAGPFAPPKIILTQHANFEIATRSLRLRQDGTALALDVVAKQDGLAALAEAVETALQRAAIFISYGQPDMRQATALFHWLAAIGHRPWMDRYSLVGGEDWEQAIGRAIWAADFFVLCLSNQTGQRAGYMMAEIRLALNLWEQKLEDDVYLIPVRFDDCTMPFIRVGRLQWIDLFEPGGQAQLAQAIQIGLRRRLARA